MPLDALAARVLRGLLQRVEGEQGEADGNAINTHTNTHTNKPAPPALPRQLWDEVTALESLTRAWAKVRANGGGAGTDGQTVEGFERQLQHNLRKLQRDLHTGAYRPEPVLRVYVPKRRGGQRPLSLLAVRDRVAQRAVYDLLGPFYEGRFLDCSYAFREHRSTQDAVNAIVAWRSRGLRWVVDGDIAQYFERIDHDLLMNMLADDVQDRRVLRLIRLWLKARVLNELEQATLAARAGTPQGGVISPLLSNVYLHQFDEALLRQNLALVRYADDWVILCKREAAAHDALTAAREALAQLKLAINPHRTRVTSFERGFSFVGAFFVRNEQYWISPGH
jgi:group II intron reverse transcriptase/maturase